MRHEAIEYCNSIRLNIPALIDRGKEHKYRVNKRQVEAACEYLYLQVRDHGFDPFAPGLRLPVYVLNRAKKIRLGRYYKVNKGDPILLDDLTALTTLSRNLLNANTVNLDIKHKLFVWRLYFLLLSSGVTGVILNMVF